MRHPQTHEAEIAGASGVDEVRLEFGKAVKHKLLVAHQERIEVKIDIQGNGRGAALQLLSLNAAIGCERCLTAAAHNQKRKVSRLGEVDELAA